MNYNPICTITSIIGKRGSGKTELLKEMIRLYKDKFNAVFLISPTEYINNAFVKDNLVDKDKIKYEYDEEWIIKLINKMSNVNKDKTKESKDAKFVLLILDDCLGDITMRNPKYKSLKLLASRGRHLLISVWITGQALKLLSPLFRMNSDYLFIGKLIKADVENIANEFCVNMKTQDLVKEIEKHTNDYGFFVINNNTSNPKNCYGLLKIEV